MPLRLGALLVLALTVVLAFGCGGGNGRSLTGEERSPSPSGTAPIFQRSPVGGTPTQRAGASPTASPAAAPTATPAAAASPAVEVSVTPVAETFEIMVDEAVNIRDRPSSQDTTILGGIYPGDKAKVIGEAHGQEVEAGKGDLWYQVELTRNATTVRGFVYAPLVRKV